MSEELESEIVKKFLLRVIEIEQSPAFVRKGQESARKEAILKALDEFCK